MANKNTKPAPKTTAVSQPASVPKQEKTKQPTDWFSVKYLSIALAIISFLVYANTLQNGYVLDDGMVLKNNTMVTRGISAIPDLLTTPRLWGIGLSHNDFYRPLSMVMFAIEVQFFGVNPTAGHFFNILVFAGCVVIFFLFLYKFFDGKKPAVAFIASLLFAIHPIHTEIVANIKSRDELLCYFFGFWTLNLFMKYMDKGKTTQLLFGLLTFFLAFISKETVVTFLAIVPVLFFFYKNNNKRRAIVMTGGVVAVTVLFLIIRSVVLNRYYPNGDSYPIEFIDNPLVRAPSAVSRIATELLIMGKYLKLLLIPYPLLSCYAFNSIPYAGFTDIWVLLSVALYVLIVFAAVSRFIKDKKDPWAFGVFFYLVTLALFSNFAFLIGAQMAERFLFFPSTGFCLIAALAIEKWIIKSEAADAHSLKKPKLLALLVPVFLVYSVMTMARNIDWQSNTSLYRADSKNSPNDGRLYFWLGHAVTADDYDTETDTAKKRQLDMEGIGYLLKSAQIMPDRPETQQQLGFVFNREHMYDSGIAHDLMGLKIDPNHTYILNHMGTTYYEMGRYQDAVASFKRCAAVDPKYIDIYSNIASAYFQMKLYDSSTRYFKYIQPNDPKYFVAQNAIADAYLWQGNYDSSLAHGRITVMIKPNDADVINNLGCKYFAAKRYPQAIELFQKTLSLNPKNTNALANMGRAYVAMGQYKEAADAFSREIAIAPNNATDLSYLAMAYGKMGDVETARKYEAMAHQVK